MCEGALDRHLGALFSARRRSRMSTAVRIRVGGPQLPRTYATSSKSRSHSASQVTRMRSLRRPHVAHRACRYPPPPEWSHTCPLSVQGGSGGSRTTPSRIASAVAHRRMVIRGATGAGSATDSTASTWSAEAHVGSSLDASQTQACTERDRLALADSCTRLISQSRVRRAASSRSTATVRRTHKPSSSSSGHLSRPSGDGHQHGADKNWADESTCPECRVARRDDQPAIDHVCARRQTVTQLGWIFFPRYVRPFLASVQRVHCFAESRIGRWFWSQGWTCRRSSSDASGILKVRPTDRLACTINLVDDVPSVTPAGV